MFHPKSIKYKISPEWFDSNWKTKFKFYRKYKAKNHMLFLCREFGVTIDQGKVWKEEVEQILNLINELDLFILTKLNLVYDELIQENTFLKFRVDKLQEQLHQMRLAQKDNYELEKRNLARIRFLESKTQA